MEAARLSSDPLRERLFYSGTETANCRRRPHERGGALLMSVVLAALVGAMAGSMVMVHLHGNRLKLDYIQKIEASLGAGGAANYAVESIWNGFVTSNNNEAGSLSKFR